MTLAKKNVSSCAHHFDLQVLHYNMARKTGLQVYVSFSCILTLDMEKIIVFQSDLVTYSGQESEYTLYTSNFSNLYRTFKILFLI